MRIAIAILAAVLAVPAAGCKDKAKPTPVQPGAGTAAAAAGSQEPTLQKLPPGDPAQPAPNVLDLPT